MAQPAPIPKWEYTFFDVTSDQPGGLLNQLGLQGWEAVAIITVKSQQHILMKRPVP